MFRKPRLALVALAAGSLVMSACADQPGPAEPFDDGPQVQTPFFAYAPAPGMDILYRVEPLKMDVSVTGEIEVEDGGWLSLPKAGIKVYIPSDALSEELWGEDVQITLTALAGDYVAWEFAPHGMSFTKPVKIYVDKSMTQDPPTVRITWDGSRALLPDYLGVYYTGDGSQGGVVPEETFPVYYEKDWNGGWLVFETEHFSGYAIAGEE
jgi:hypothetical protein